MVDAELSSRQQIQFIQGDDNLAAGQKFFQISQAIQRMIREQLLPEARWVAADQCLGERAAIVHAHLV